MRPAKRLILGSACVISIALCALLLLQSAGLLRPSGVGWGDGTRAHAYSAEAIDGLLVFRVASGMRTAPPGRYTYEVQSLGSWNGAGIHYRRWNMTAGRLPLAPVLGTFAEVQIGLGWPVLASLALTGLWLIHSVKQRRLARSGHCCRNCGYDLRATPDRCPECGLVPATAATPAA